MDQTIQISDAIQVQITRLLTVDLQHSLPHFGGASCYNPPIVIAIEIEQ